jgi:hypothetical protein
MGESPAARQIRGIRSQGIEFYDKSFMFAKKKTEGKNL